MTEVDVSASTRLPFQTERLSACSRTTDPLVRTSKFFSSTGLSPGCWPEKDSNSSKADWAAA
jgi:hypothetical protein